MATLETVTIKITGDSKDLNKTIDQLEKVGKVDRQNAESFKKTSAQQGKAMDFVKGKALALGGALLGAFALKSVVTSAVNILKTFEKEMSTLQSITGSTVKEMEFFAQASKDVGKATKTSATEVVKAFTQIGSAQPELLKNGKALSEVTKQALILSKAAGIDASEAAIALTGAMNQFGVSADQAAKFTDIFATSQQKGSSFISATSEALKNSGAAANAAGLSFETTNAAIQALAKGALTGSEAGTALRGVLIKLSSQSDSTINPSMVGLGKTIDELESRNLSLADATKLVGQEGATGLLTLIKQNKTFKELDGNLNEVGNAMSQLLVNTDNLDGSLDELDNAYESFVLTLGQSTGVLKTVTDSLTDFLNVTTDIIDSDIDVIGQSLLLIDQFLLQGVAARQVAEEIAKQKKETDDLAESTGEAIEAIEEETESTNKSTKSKKKQLTAIELLNKQISALKKELLNQALAGDIDTETLKELKAATDELEKAQFSLAVAMSGPAEEMERRKIVIDDTAKLEVKTVKLTGETVLSQLDDERDARDRLTDKRLKAIAAVSEAEQAAFSILAQLNENKLIGIDNTERAELKALENKELSEEELAKRQLEIQTKADEQRAKILTKQAKADKLAAIFAATINTATAVTRALVTSTLFAVVVGALGAAEIAAIAAQPIPVFHEGKKPELKEGEMFAKILKSESVIPPEQSKKYKGAIDSMIDKNFESYVMKEYMLPMIKTMGKSEPEPFNDVNLWSNQKKQIGLMRESNALSKAMIRAMESSNSRRSWR